MLRLGALGQPDGGAAALRQPGRAIRLGRHAVVEPGTARLDRGFRRALAIEVRGAAADQVAALEQAAGSYRERFSYPFVWHTPGTGAEQLLAAVRERLANDSDLELRTAAEEQRKLTRRHLERLIAQ